MLTTGCSTIDGPEFKGDGHKESLLFKVEIAEQAAMIQVNDSLDLTLYALSMEQDTINLEDGEVMWSSSDSAVLRVNQNGRIVARNSSPFPVDIIVRFNHNRVTKRDTIKVLVTEDRYDATDVTLTLIDSAYVGMFGLPVFGFPRVRLDLYRDGALLLRGAQAYLSAPTLIQLEYTFNSDPLVGNYYLVNNRNGYFGPFWIRAVMNLYGTNVRDSVEMVATYPTSELVLIFESEGTIIGGTSPNSSIRKFRSCSAFFILQGITRPVDIVFSDSLATDNDCPPTPGLDEQIIQQIGGNILNVPPFASIVRKSKTKGEVTFWFRDAVTKDSIPFQYRIQQVDVTE